MNVDKKSSGEDDDVDHDKAVQDDQLRDLYDVIIVGSGFAGIGSARRFIEKGISNILILEANDRIGGRAWTLKRNGFRIELGCEFIHGENSTTRALCDKFQIPIPPIQRKENLCFADSNASKIALPVFSLKNGNETNGIHSEARFIRDLKDGYNSLEFRVNFHESEDISLERHLEKLNLFNSNSKERFEIADVLLAQTCCAPITKLSCLDLQREMKSDRSGELEFRIGGGEGYSGLVNELSFGLNFELNFNVKEIRQRTMNWNGLRNVIEIKSSDGRIRRARKCVVTVPIGILKDNKIQFSPNLPKTIENSINQFEIHAGTKIFVCFKSKFWNDNQMTYVCNHLGMLKRWWCSHDQPMLCSYITSYAATAIDNLSDDQLREIVFRELNQLYPKTFTMEILNGQFAFIQKSSWANQPFSGGGAYAFCPVGGSKARESLCIPIFNNCLTFAGEHTAFQSNPQTTHGAFDSGVFAADRLLSNEKQSKL